MEDAIKAFVMHLQVERNASQETIRSYRSDLHQLVRFLQPTKEDTTPIHIDTVTSDNIRAHLRGWIIKARKRHPWRENWRACEVFFGFSFVRGSFRRTPRKT